MAVRLSVGVVSNSLKRRFMVLGLNLKCPCTFCTHVWYMRSKLFFMMSLILKSTREFSSFRQILTMYAMSRRESWTRRELWSFSSHGVTSPASYTQSFRQGSVTFHFISCRVDPKKSISSSFIIIILTTSSMIFPSGTPYRYGSDWPPSQMRLSNTCELQLNSPSLNRSYAAWYRYLTCPSPCRLTRPYRFSIMFIVRSHNMNQYELASGGKEVSGAGLAWNHGSTTCFHPLC